MNTSGGQRSGRVGFRIVALLTVALVLAPVWVWAQEEKGNVVFFRGGFAGLTSDRSGEVFTDVFGLGGRRNDGNTGYYVGGGLNLLLTKDLWGMMNKVWAVGEIGLEFKRFNSKSVTEAVPSTCGAIPALTPPCSIRTNKVQVTMLTIDIAPKFKFMEGAG